MAARAAQITHGHPTGYYAAGALAAIVAYVVEGESLGEGWVAEQALAIGVYCALVAPSVRDGLLLSVNHSGDSDSPGSVCGNLLGARNGDLGLPHDWVERVEGRAQIAALAALADDLAAESVRR